MAVSIPRLRIWFAVMAVAVAVVAAGYYVHARYQQWNALRRDLPKKIGIDIQQSSEGFTLSKSEGGHTVFSIHASKVLQYKAGGRAHLQDVNIIVYGRNSDRFDQIYGSDFDYDPEAGTVVAHGEVQIDLEGNAEGRLRADQTLPREMRNPIHLRAEGIVFNQKTGLAECEGVVEFRVPQASGTARGAKYSTKDNTLELRSAVEVKTAGKQATEIQAASGTFTKEPRVLEMNGASLSSEQHQVQADHATLDIGNDNSIQNVHMRGNVKLNDASGLDVSSPRAEMKLGAHNTLETGRFLDGVEMSSRQQATSGHSGEMVLHFVPVAPAKGGDKNAPAEAQLKTIDAIHGVTLHRAAPGKGANPQETTIKADAMTFAISNGRQVQSAQTVGPGQVTLRSVLPQHAGEATVADAQHFTAEFGDANQLRALRGNGAVKVVSKSAKQADKVSTSNSIVAEFTPAGEVSRLIQEGNFRYREAQSSSNEPGGRTAFAERANYSPQDDSLSLSGAPRVVDGGMTVTADSIRLLRGTGEAFAQGNVKTTYSELKVQPNGALLATADPVHVTAHAMNALQMSGLAHYTGNARLWQGSNIVEAQTIDFDQKARTIIAEGDNKRPVTSVFLQTDKKGKSSSILVTAPHLSYADVERKAIYSGGVTARGEDAVMSAERAEIFLGAAGAARSSGPSQLDHIVATGRVVVQQQERRAQGEHLLYTAAAGTYVITGGAPALTDPVNGTVHGDSLTFYSRDDRVVVEGNGSSRTVTHTHVSR